MVDWESAAIGAASSLLVSLFVFHYQNWKSNVRSRVLIFYQARSQIRLNLEVLLLIQLHADMKDNLLEKIQFLPPYPFSASDHIDDGFRALSESYNTELLHAVSGEIEYDKFEEITLNQSRLMDMMIHYWGGFLQNGAFSRYISLPFFECIRDANRLWFRLISKIKHAIKRRRDEKDDQA